MSFEDEIKQAFDRHSDDVSPSPIAWAGVERGVRRAHARRLAAVSSATAVFVALAVAIPLALTGGERNPEGFANNNETEMPSPATSATPPTPLDTSDWKPVAAVADGFSLRIPPDWRGGWFEGIWDFHPASLPSINQGGDTYSVEIAVEPGMLRYPCGSGLGRCSQPAPRGEMNDWLRIRLDPSATTVIVHIVGNDPDLVSTHYRKGETILGTLAGYDGSTPVHGGLTGVETPDAYSRALVRFMDARVEGIGADEMTCCSAATKYQDSTYTVRYGSTEYDIAGWSDAGATPARNTSAATVTFTITMDLRAGSESTDRMERITVGYESGRASSSETPVVLDVEVTGDGP